MSLEVLDHAQPRVSKLRVLPVRRPGHANAMAQGNVIERGDQNKNWLDNQVGDATGVQPGFQYSVTAHLVRTLKVGQPKARALVTRLLGDRLALFGWRSYLVFRERLAGNDDVWVRERDLPSPIVAPRHTLGVQAITERLDGSLDSPEALGRRLRIDSAILGTLEN